VSCAIGVRIEVALFLYGMSVCLGHACLEGIGEGTFWLPRSVKENGLLVQATEKRNGCKSGGVQERLAEAQ